MQLDLFEDSRDVLLRNDALAALRARDEWAALSSLAKLRKEYPEDRFLEPLGTLIDALATLAALKNPEAENRMDASMASDALARLEKYAAVAERLFGVTYARDWLAPLWRVLAEYAAGLPFAAEMPSIHAAAIFLRAHDWNAAEAAVASIPAWRRMPQPLAWMAEIQHARTGLAAAWPLLAELAWLSPARFDTLARRLDARALRGLLRDFDADFESDAIEDTDPAWFPAWALIVEPSLASVLRQAEAKSGTAPERCFQLVLQLLDLERQGRHAEIVACRKSLRDLHAGLFKCYMSTR